jgi:hypothetical protein
MGKSFKTYIKPESQKDILDLTIEEKENPVISVTSIKSTKEDLNKKSPKDPDPRLTLITSSYNMERLKDYVHTRRVNGDTNYTQKDALSDALKLLFQSIDIIERPENAYQKEKHS